MKRKRVLYAAIAAALIGGYAIYATFFLEKIAIGELCRSNGACEGKCIGFGYDRQEVCTKECAGASDCPAPTTCEEITLISSDGKGTQTEAKHYCLPAALPK